LPSEKKFASQLKREIARVRLLEGEDNLVDFEKFMFEKNEVDEIFNEPLVPDSEFKFYPGSDKGPYPEDDP
jgi:hypothetical protein